MRPIDRIALPVITLLVTVSGAAVPAVQAQATPQGRYAANLVDQAQYEYVHNNLLYTHDGDDCDDGPAHDLRRTAIQTMLTSFGLSTTLDPFTYAGHTYYNVVAELPGTTRPDDIYVFGAHFDTVGNPGADDNASGIAALLEVARLVSQWPAAATIRFIAFDREEQGLIGSDEYVGAHEGDNFVGMIACDMLAYRGAIHTLARIYGREQSDPVKYALAAALTEYAGIQSDVDGMLDRSDHAPFEWRGFQAARLVEYDFWTNPYYHEMSDSADTPGCIDYEYAIALTRGTLGWLVDAAGVWPAHPAGDLNCDYNVDVGDVNPFVLALSDEAGYQAQYPDCPWLNADTNGDGQVDFGDIGPFAAALFGPCSAPQTVGELTPVGEGMDDWFGAAVTVDANLALVGAPGDDSLGNGAGAAYVFEQTGATWVRVAKLTASDAAEYDTFGSAVAISGDVAVVGAPSHDGQAVDAGAAYVFERADGVWTEVIQLTASDGADCDGFGRSVAISGDMLVVGADGNDEQGFDAGAAYMFQRVDGVWTPAGKLTASDGTDGDAFGVAAAISGSTLVIGAYRNAGGSPGSAYVFESVGGVWTETAELAAADGVMGDNFGHAVAIHGDVIALGASVPAEWADGPGAAYVFERVGTAWTQTAKLGAWVHTHTISVATNGDVVLVGRDIGDVPANAGEVYIFDHVGGTWAPAAAGGRLRAYDGVTGDFFGTSVALSGTTVVAGAVWHFEPPAAMGAAYVVDLSGDGVPWIAQQPVDQAVGVGGSTTFSVVAVGPGELSYRWRRGGRRLTDDGHISGATTATLTINPVGPEDAGVYEVVIRGLCGANTSDGATLTIVVAAD